VGSNPSRQGGKPATNRLSYDTAFLANYATTVVDLSAEPHVGLQVKRLLLLFNFNEN
jgi:hypothetical protein